MPNTNRVYILGAGFSIAAGAGVLDERIKMPSMQELSEAVLSDLRNSRPGMNYRSNAAQSSPERFQRFAESLTDDQRQELSALGKCITEMMFEGTLPGAGTPLVNNFEQWLSYLTESPPWLSPSDQMRNRAAFLDVAESVAQVIQGRQRLTVLRQKVCPEWLAELVQIWDRDGSTVLTFNYDHFVELAWTIYCDRTEWRTQSWDLYPVQIMPLVAQGGVARPYIPGGNLRLLKLHGSLGWRYSGLDGPPTDVVYDSGVAGGSWTIEGLFAVDPQTAGGMDDRPQMIVPPAAIKSPYYSNQILRSLWRQAALQLRHAEEIIIMGFSLPATDMIVSSMLATNVSSECVITPVDFGNAIVERVCATFGIQSDNARLNKSYVDLGDQAIPRWVEDEVARRNDAPTRRSNA